MVVQPQPVMMSQSEVEAVCERQFDFAPLSKVMSDVKSRMFKVERNRKHFQKQLGKR